MRPRRIVVGTDVVLEHLRGTRRPSVLRRAMSLYFCYATVFTAIELFEGARTARERQAVRDAMAAMKILGLNPRNAPLHAALFKKHRNRRQIDLLVAGLCIESGLPLLTGRTEEFGTIRGLTVMAPDDLREKDTGRRLTRSVQRRTIR